MLKQEGSILEAAWQTKVKAQISRHRPERDEYGNALVMRNGRSQEQTVGCRITQAAHTLHPQ